jgi:cell wall-associated NlpC family hydrolase
LRPIRFLILLLVLTGALLVALVRPLPSHAGDASQTTRKQHRTRKARRQRVHVPEARHPFGQRVVHYARRFLGVPYRYGGDSPRGGFDCSGLVRFVYSHFGVALPHSSYADIERGRRIGRRGLKPGDLVFFDGAGHVGIYVGSNRFIHAPHTGTVVQISTLSSSWYGATYDGARRVHAYR